MAASGCPLSKSQIQIMKTSIMLLNLPSSNAEIVNVLEQMEQILSGVKQSPSKSMLQVLHPISEALIAQELVTHPDMGVNISVACCICETMRIMAPGNPYNDKQMKNFFEMVVITFEKLSSTSGGCYTKMAKVLKIFHKYRLCVLILDLDLDLDGHGLIVRLFKQFLTVADSNSSAIVYEMEKIMTMIIDESKELKRELQCFVVASVKRDNQIASHVCWQLGEKVLMNCAAQLKPDLPDMGRDMSIALYDYSKMVAHICKTASENYNTVVNETIPYTTEIPNLGKDITHRIKLECINTVRHCQQGIHSVDGKKDEKITLSFDDPSMPSKSVTELKAQIVEHGENLVGSRIKVWWPGDKMYYTGVVQFFDNINKRHKVLYDDGDEELLDLQWENWEFVENGGQTLHGQVKKGSHGEVHFSRGNERRKKVSSSKSRKICVMGPKALSSLHESHSQKQRSHEQIHLACGNERRRKISSSQSPEICVMGLEAPSSLHESHSQKQRSHEQIHLACGNERRRKISSSQSPEICVMGLEAPNSLHVSHSQKQRNLEPIHLACGNGRRGNISSSQPPEICVMGLKASSSRHESHSQKQGSPLKCSLEETKANTI